MQGSTLALSQRVDVKKPLQTGAQCSGHSSYCGFFPGKSRPQAQCASVCLSRFEAQGQGNSQSRAPQDRLIHPSHDTIKDNDKTKGTNGLNGLA